MQGREIRNFGRLSDRRKGTPRAAAVIAVLALVGFAAVACSSGNAERAAAREQKTVVSGATRTPTTMPTPQALPSGALEPGTYVVSTLDQRFDASHWITIEVPEGFRGVDEFAVLKLGARRNGLSAWLVDNVYADPCQWRGTLLDRPVGQLDALVTSLASQRGFNVSTPTDITVDGFAGKYMERIAPAGINPTDCDGGQYRTWLASDGGAMWVEPGQHDLMWIVDVDGVPLVLDAPLATRASAQVRAELLRMVQSVRIDPR